MSRLRQSFAWGRRHRELSMPGRSCGLAPAAGPHRCMSGHGHRSRRCRYHVGEYAAAQTNSGGGLAAAVERSFGGSLAVAGKSSGGSLAVAGKSFGGRSVGEIASEEHHRCCKCPGKAPAGGDGRCLRRGQQVLAGSSHRSWGECPTAPPSMHHRKTSWMKGWELKMGYLEG